MFIMNTTLLSSPLDFQPGGVLGVLQTRGKTDSIETWTNKLPAHQPSSSTPSTILTDQIHRCKYIEEHSNQLLWSVGIVEGVEDEG